MGITLEAIDQVRERTGVSYRRAYEALQAADGDVVAALIALEGEGGGWFSARGQDLRHIWREGSATRVVVRHKGRTLVEVPATLAAVGSVVFPMAAVAGLAAALASRSSIALERD